MLKTATAAAFAASVLFAPSISEAKGCIKGALVGGIVGLTAITACWVLPPVASSDATRPMRNRNSSRGIP